MIGMNKISLGVDRINIKPFSREDRPATTKCLTRLGESRYCLTCAFNNAPPSYRRMSIYVPLEIKLTPARTEFIIRTAVEV